MTLVAIVNKLVTIRYMQARKSHVQNPMTKLIQLTENDNLRNECVSLFEDVPKDIAFARIALHREPDAVNFWLGMNESKVY